MTDNNAIIGLIPAAGKAERIQPLPCSKEILPVGCQTSKISTRPSTRVVIGYLLESMHRSGVQKAYIILRKGKWDIPNYLGDGTAFGPQLAYLVTEVLDGVPYTVDQAYPFLNDTQVLFGFPDIIFEPVDAFLSLIKRQRATAADITLGLFPTANPSTMDMVKTTRKGTVISIHIKPARTKIKNTWVIAIWGRQFYCFLNSYLKKRGKPHSGEEGVCELYMGEVINGAITAGLKVESVSFPNGRCLDIGTPEGLRSVLGKHTELKKGLL